MAFFLDDPQDLDWAKSAWEATVFHPEETHKPRT
jgi:hypothetical protein